jgi:hypothetical protein
MKAALLAALAALVLSCAASQHAPSRYGTVRVGFAERGFRADHLSAMRNQLRALEALGPSFAETSPTIAEIVVAAVDANGCEHGAAWSDATRATVYIDIACVTGPEELRAALGHEIGHQLGMQHICRPRERRADCSPVGVGYAMMNTAVSHGDAFAEGPPFAVPTLEPTALDLAEFRRVHP